MLNIALPVCKELNVCNQCDKVGRNTVSPWLTKPYTLTSPASVQMCDADKIISDCQETCSEILTPEGLGESPACSHQGRRQYPPIQSCLQEGLKDTGRLAHALILPIERPGPERLSCWLQVTQPVAELLLEFMLLPRSHCLFKPKFPGWHRPWSRNSKTLGR